MTRRVAAVDCGTNSLRLLVADVGPELTDVTRRMEIVRLGQGVDQTGRLAPEALARTAGVLRDYADVIAATRAGAVRMVATSATRDASNAAEFTGQVKEILGVAPEVLTGSEDITSALDRTGARHVIIAFSRAPVDELLLLLRRLRDCPVQVDLVPRLYELVGLRVTMHSVEGVPLLGLPPNPTKPVERALKRAMDAAVAAVALTALSPVFAYIAARIRLDSGGPVFFRQTRLGVDMKEFTAFKFRTMKVGTDQSVHRAAVRRSSLGLADSNDIYKPDRADAVTTFGRGLRRTSLDELPQLINVLRGEMSLVGPRPCIPYEVENFEPHHLERFAVPQGMTGLWQVTARANCTFLEALEMDVVYARSWSLGLDLRLLLRTPLQVLRQRKATA